MFFYDKGRFLSPPAFFIDTLAVRSLIFCQPRPIVYSSLTTWFSNTEPWSMMAIRRLLVGRMSTRPACLDLNNDQEKV
ncbi:MAG: hypothetical protein ACI8PP_001022 [Candidatus Pseudothioglobus sp.]|jgi:hypothetical protein